MRNRLTRVHAIVLLLATCACATAVAPPSPPVAASAAVCPAPDAQTRVLGVAPVRVDGAAAKQLVAEGARLVDVRAPDFYAREHIAGAINVPVAAIADRASAEIGPPATPVVLYCRTGAGSAKAAQILASLGYARIYDLGSYLNWGEGAPAPTPLPR